MIDCVFKIACRRCAALTRKSCKGCRFRKTRKQLEEGRRKADERILSLPYEQREHILNKYGRNIDYEG